MKRPVYSKLRSLYAPTQRGSGFEREEPSHRGLVVTFCILASCVLWFAFSMQETYTQIIELPTEVRNLPMDKALIQEPPTSVLIQVEGEGVQILRLYYNPPTIPIDVSVGDVDMFLVAPDVLNNVSLQTVTPRQISLSLDDRITRRVPVEARVDVQFEPGHQMIGGISVIPDSIAISGAQSIVESIRAWPTKTRNIGSLSDSLNAVIELSDSLSGLLNLNASEVRVQADIQEFTEGRRSVKVRVTGADDGQTVTFVPETVNVVYQVPLSQYDASMDAEDFFVFVPYADILRDDQGRVYPMLHPPEGLEIRRYRLDPDFLGYYDTRNER